MFLSNDKTDRNVESFDVSFHLDWCHGHGLWMPDNPPLGELVDERDVILLEVLGLEPRHRIQRFLTCVWAGHVSKV